MIFHLVTPDDWAAAVEAGDHRPASLATEGFVHFSFADQVAGSANRHYGDVAELLALEVDPAGLDVRVEDTYGRGTAFPHLYGPFPMTAVTASHRVTRDHDGRWTFGSGGVSPGGEGAVASPDR